MLALQQLDEVAAPLPGSDIDTDQIVPARFMHLRRVDYGRYLFHDQRYDESGAESVKFALNQHVWRESRILVVGPNFGCGSSREQAVHALADFGIRALVGTSFGDIFYANCMKNGVLAVRARADFVSGLFHQLNAASGARVFIDLPQQLVVAPDGSFVNFVIDAFHKESLLLGRDEIDLTLHYLADIERYERCHGLASRAVRRKDGAHRRMQSKENS